MTAYEMLHFICQVKHNGEYTGEIDRFLRDYQLYEQRNVLMKKLSIIMALLGGPRLVILDEPTNGIDTSGLVTLKKSLEQISKDGAVIVLTSHVLDFIESIYSKCAFLLNGRIESVLCAGECDLEEKYESLYL
jgi:ABC-type multidrug transport system ATPase subunit